MKPIKKYILTLLSLLFLAPFASAQQKGEQRADIDIRLNRIEVHTDSLTLDMDINASHIKIGTVESLQLDIVIEDSTRRAFLPYVLYTGKNRYLYDRRNEILSHEKSEVSPYYIYKGINSKKSYNLRYIMTIAYAAWMDHASVYVRHSYHDCCNRWLVKHDILRTGLSRDNTPAITEEPIAEPAAIWTPDPLIYGLMVQFITPEPEPVKNRVAFVSANIDYPRSVYKVRPEFGKNPEELLKVDSLVKKITDNSLIRVNSLNITGYASPEGTHKSNELLAKRRATGFKEYLTGKYSLRGTPINTYWVAEDWSGLIKLINNADMEYKSQVMDIIEHTDIFDGREKKLMELASGAPYTYMLDNFFPQLRRIELRADYTVHTIDSMRAAELIYTRPELLSLDEMYRVAGNYTPGTTDYKLVYEIAAQTYPASDIANNNAAAACLMSGEIQSAMHYLSKLGNNPMGYINHGVYHYIKGDKSTAEHYFRLSEQTDPVRAETNLKLLNRK